MTRKTTSNQELTPDDDSDLWDLPDAFVDAFLWVVGLGLVGGGCYLFFKTMQDVKVSKEPETKIENVIQSRETINNNTTYMLMRNNVDNKKVKG